MRNDNVSLCVGRSKGKAGIQMKCIPGKRDTTEMYPGKVMHIIVTVLAKTSLVRTKTEFSFIAAVYRHTQYLSIPSASSVNC